MFDPILEHYGLVQEEVLDLLYEIRFKLREQNERASRNVETLLYEIEMAFHDAHAVLSMQKTLALIGTILADWEFLVTRQLAVDDFHNGVLPDESFAIGRRFLGEVLGPLRQQAQEANPEYQFLLHEHRSTAKAFSLAFAPLVVPRVAGNHPMAVTVGLLVLLCLSQAVQRPVQELEDEDILHAIDQMIEDTKGEWPRNP